MAGLVVLLHVIGFGLLIIAVAPEHYRLGDAHQAFTVGVGVLAYSFGLRHAFDVDHIAAIDNTTRKLLADGQRPLSVGFWFSLGHSTVVFALALLLAVGVKSIVGPLEDGGSRLHAMADVIGPSVSGGFLWLLGALNLAVLIGIVRALRKLRAGTFDDAEFDRRLASRGLLNRILGGLTRRAAKPWQIYPVGVLFGLGFDTATEVGLLVLAGGAATFAVPSYAILVLPTLFAAGMCLMDTADGMLMMGAYGWTAAKPVRKIVYNLTVTSISVATALLIGSIELLGVLVDGHVITAAPLAAVARIDLDYAGYALAGVFAAAWLIALAVGRFARWRPGRLSASSSRPGET
ncbi:HoxN/HupN/NixA family nickel/cobalt transporter [Gryllotalpicola protaetiae]|nr:HoxN/HupN/NixA family nickel/cobalt transporter [Gryllotalpicola protaetiae]